jgi:hypothetical protein
MRSLTLAPLILLAGCCTPGFTDAVRAYHDVVSPSYLQYVAADVGLTDKQRASRRDAVAALEAALVEAEAGGQ